METEEKPSETRQGADQTSRNCTKCLERKPYEQFHRTTKSKSGRRAVCASCAKEHNTGHYWANREKRIAQVRQWIDSNPEKHLSYALRRYGITPEDYQAMLVSQANGCAICRLPCVSGNRLSVDHCHTSGAVRGLLCRDCNTSLGKFKDNQDLLIRAAIYLHAAKRRQSTDTRAGS